MEPKVPLKKLESGIFQGIPESDVSKKFVPARLMRTMRLDSEEAIKNQNETTVSIAIAEEKKKSALSKKTAEINLEAGFLPPAPKPIGRIVVVIVILFIIALLVLAYIFVLPKFDAIKLPSFSFPSFTSNSSTTAPFATTTTELIAPSSIPIIPAQSEKQFNITGQTQAQVFAGVIDELKQGMSSDSIKYLYFVEKSGDILNPISANRLITLSGISTPEILTRSLEKSFMAGFWGEKNGMSIPFMILKVSGNETGIAGMLEWEAMLPRFFDTVFGAKIESSLASAVKFRDIVVLGKDARVMDSSSSASVVYSFANANTIVIATSKPALEKLLPLAGKN